MTTYSQAQTFTRTEARYLASKVVADLHQCARIYRYPSISGIADYESELVEWLVKGYVDKYEFGFKKGDERVVSWRYQIKNGDLVGGSADDRPGGVYARADVSSTDYYNILTPSWKWESLPDSEKTLFEETLPFQRGTGSLPRDGIGYWSADKTYTKGGVEVKRETFRPL
jgi:hypothetical protein